MCLKNCHGYSQQSKLISLFESTSKTLPTLREIECSRNRPNSLLKKYNFVRKCDTQMIAYLGSVDLGLFDS